MKNLELISVLAGVINDYCGEAGSCSDCWLHNIKIYGHDACDEIEEIISTLLVNTLPEKDGELRTKESIIKEYKAGITGIRKRLFCERYECKKCLIKDMCKQILTIEDALVRKA